MSESFAEEGEVLPSTVGRQEADGSRYLEPQTGYLPIPWAYTTRPLHKSVTVATRGEMMPRPFVSPLLYARGEFPRANALPPETFAAPTLKLIATGDAILMPKHLVMSRKLGRLVKQSFLRSRHKGHGGLTLDKPSDTYMPRDVVMAEYERLDDAVYVADSDYGQIWGHFLLEVLPRLWGLNEVKRSTKVATSVPLQRMHLTILDALGIAPGRLIPLTRPLLPRRTYLPEPPVRIRSYVHPVAFEIFDRIARLRFRSTVTPLERIYVSRRKVGSRKLSNEAEVESLFESIGFTVIHPQELAIEDQIALFAGARFIAGPGGSGMHNTVFSSDRARILNITSAGWYTRIDALLSQVPHRLGYVFGEPNTMPRKGHQTNADWSISRDDVRAAARAHFEL